MKKYSKGGGLGSAIKKKVKTALSQRSSVRSAGAAAKAEAVRQAGNKKAAEKGKKAFENANKGAARRNLNQYKKSTERAENAESKGRAGQAARIKARRDIRLGRDLTKNAEKKNTAKAKAIKNQADKTSRRVNRLNRRAENREERTYGGGGKVVAQGATRKDVRREKRQARKSGRKA